MLVAQTDSPAKVSCRQGKGMAVAQPCHHQGHCLHEEMHLQGGLCCFWWGVSQSLTGTRPSGQALQASGALLAMNAGLTLANISNNAARDSVAPVRRMAPTSIFEFAFMKFQA